MLQGWFQKFLVRQSNTSPGSDDDDTSSAQAPVLPSTTKAATTFRENGKNNCVAVIYIRMYVHIYMLFIYNSLCAVAVITTEPSTADDSHPQQDGGDIGASVIEHLPAGVSVQCKFDTPPYVYVRVHDI